MDYISLALLLAAVGFALILAELFIPSGGLITVGCVVSFVASIWFAYRGWWETSQGLFWTFSTSLLVGIPIFLLYLLRLLETTRLGDRILLKAPRLEDVTPLRDVEERLQKLVGKKGKTISMLNPGGMVLVEGERLHAFTEGVLVDPNDWIEVLEVRGARVLVRRTSAPVLPPLDSTAGSPASPASAEPARPEGQLDFDLPQN